MTKTPYQPVVVFEDQDLVVIAKPAGVVVNEAKTLTETTIQSWAREQLPVWAEETSQDKENGKENGWQSLVPPDFDASYGTPEELFKVRAGMVHRIDRETSGVLVWAKNPGSLVNLLTQFKNRTIQKTYQALVHGTVQPLTGEVTAPIGRIPWKKGLFGVMPSGRPASTQYQVVRQLELTKATFAARAKAAGLFPGQSADKIATTLQDYFVYTLVDCKPKTGRTHQIRVHMQHIHHPLAGDALYVGKKRQKFDALWCPRHFLHAAAITFTHPRTGKSLTFHAPLPEDLQTVLELME